MTVQELQGTPDGSTARCAIVVARFNFQVTSLLLEGAIATLKAHGVSEERIAVFWVPGAFEIPLLAKELGISQRYDTVICLGTIIKKQTAHFEYVAAECSRGIAEASRETGTPAIFGVLTTYTLEQALERAGGDEGNRGADAALAALQMANLLSQIREWGSARTPHGSTL